MVTSSKTLSFPNINSSYSIAATVTNCRVIAQGGSCQVAVTSYTGTGVFESAVMVTNLPNGYSATGTCSIATVSPQSCNFTITASNSALVNQAESFNVGFNQIINGFATGNLNFVIGGGYSPLLNN